MTLDQLLETTNRSDEDTLRQYYKDRPVLSWDIYQWSGLAAKQEAKRAALVSDLDAVKKELKTAKCALTKAMPNGK